MGITSSNKEVSVRRIDCGGSFLVTLALSAAPDIVSSPIDIVLALDRSGSMAGSPLANLKSGSRTFIHIIDKATDSAQDGHIGCGSRIGIVSFAASATEACPLTDSVTRLDEAVDALTAKGSTNHSDAFEKAAQLFDPDSLNRRVLVLFTDGETTAGPPASPAAAALRADGVVIYCIGLAGTDGLDEAALNDWATDPDASHLAITPDDEELSSLFADLAVNISKPGATNISLLEEVTPDFQITGIRTPTRGVASLTGPTTLEWSLDALGVYGNEGAALEFTVQHVGTDSGDKAVNASIRYRDDEGNLVTFPSPRVQVDCDWVVIPEGCPKPIELVMDSCRDTVEFDAGELSLSGLGRILQLDVHLKAVCPGKRVSLAAVVSRTDDAGGEEPLGMKVVTVPAHTGPGCRDILVKCIPFILPEEGCPCGCGATLCRERPLRVRLLAQYRDVDFRCCDGSMDPAPC